MKKSVAITAVLSFHVAVIGILLAQAGCSSDSNTPEITQAKTSVSEPAQIKTTSPEVNEAMKEKDAVVLPPEGSRALRADPTRPAPEAKDEKLLQDKTLVNEPVIAPVPEKPVQPTAQPESNLATYKVQKGDNFAKIAKKHGVKISEILKVNKLDKNAVLKIGQEIKIPENGIMQPAAPQPEKVAETPQISAESEVYVVVKGDSLSRIARRHSMSVKQLMAINNLSSHNIRIGQKLQVAKGATANATSANETATAKQSKKSSKKVAKQIEAAEGEITHTIASGETLGGLAVKYGSSVKAIAERNKISDPRKIRIGQVIVIKTTKAVESAKKTTEEKPVSKTPEVTPTTPVQPPLQIQNDNATTQQPTVAPTTPSQLPQAPVVAPTQPSQTAPQATPAAPKNESDNVPILTL